MAACLLRQHGRRPRRKLKPGGSAAGSTRLPASPLPRSRLPATAVVPSPGQAAYAAAKAGLRAYFHSLSSELSGALIESEGAGGRVLRRGCLQPGGWAGLQAAEDCAGGALLARRARQLTAALTLLTDRGVGATVCCPGPLATGGDGKPRLVYGPEGLITQVGGGGEAVRRLPMGLCVYVSVTGLSVCRWGLVRRVSSSVGALMCGTQRSGHTAASPCWALLGNPAHLASVPGPQPRAGGHGHEQQAREHGARGGAHRARGLPPPGCARAHSWAAWGAEHQMPAPPAPAWPCLCWCAAALAAHRLRAAQADPAPHLAPHPACPLLPAHPARLRRCTADEAWIAYHPVLLLGYLMQYLPWAGMRVLRRVGPPRVAALREGRSGYDAGALLRGRGDPASASAASISQ